MANVPAPKQSIGKGSNGPVTLNNQCSNPWCGKQAEQVHHVCRRSYLGGPFTRVELYGRVWPNVAGVCGECHLKLELNHAVIWALEREGRYVWREKGVSEFLDPEPVLEDGESGPDVVFPSHVSGDATGSPSSSTEGGATGDEGLRTAVRHQSPGTAQAEPQGGSESKQNEGPGALSPPVPGSTCPECKRRVPLPRKPSSPKSKVYGMRVPIDEAETFGETVDAAAEHLGIKSHPHHKFRTLSLAAALVLQDEGLKDFGRR